MVPLALKQARVAIETIPVTEPATIADPQTPYTTYSRLRTLFCSTSAELVLVDPYLDSAVFHRFLTIDSNPRIVLVTQHGNISNPKERKRWTEFLDISRLFAAEKGSGIYELAVQGSGLHDRWLLVDRAGLYQLGGSVKDAGTKHFTITPAKADSGIINSILTLVASGTQYFGPRTPMHK